MASPVSIPFSGFIQIDRQSATPIYLQISQQIINAIQRGYLMVGGKLPGTRKMGEILKVHRQTIVAVYAELESQRWVETRPNKGTYIIYQSSPKFTRQPYNRLVSLAKYPEVTGYSFNRSNILDSPYDYAPCTYSLNDGVPDIRLTQIESLSHLYSASVKRKINQKKLFQHNPEGSEYFKEQLSYYLNLTRGLHISRENILITRSTEMSLYILAQLLIREGDVVLVGELSFFTANMIFKKAGAVLKTVPVDEEGIQVDYLKDLLEREKVRCIYITPHHHYPTTVSLSAQRRIELLQLANQYGVIIIEDDYDYDFQYEPVAIMPLASADIDGMVVYIGSFGKSLAPGFRTGFVVAPKNLMEEMRKYLGIIDRQGDILMEQVLGEMIEEGNIHRHIKKSMKTYKERRDHCCVLLTRLGENISFQKPSGGLAIWVEFKNKFSLLQFSNECKKRDLFIPKNILYQNLKITAIRMGFGHLSVEEMNRVFEILNDTGLSL